MAGPGDWSTGAPWEPGEFTKWDGATWENRNFPPAHEHQKLRYVPKLCFKVMFQNTQHFLKRRLFASQIQINSQKNEEKILSMTSRFCSKDNNKNLSRKKSKNLL